MITFSNISLPLPGISAVGTPLRPNIYDFLARTYAPDETRFWQPDPGTITLKQCSNNEVRAYDDKYDFDIKDSSSFGTIFRNLLTKIGAKVAGYGTPYPIQIYGTAKLTPFGYEQNK